MAITIGLAPVATEIDANGMVAAVEDVTYPITPADVGAGSFVATDQVYIDHNKPDGVISAGLNGGALSEVYKGEIGGGTWTRQLLPSNTTYKIMASASTGTFIVISYSNLYRSTDDSQTYSITYTDTVMRGGTEHNGIFLACNRSFSPYLVRSTDDGLTWPAPASQPLAPQAMASDGTTIIACGYVGAERIWVSADDGVTWSGVVVALASYDFCVAGSTAGVFFVASSASNTLIKTTDSGSTWVSETIPTAGIAKVFSANGAVFISNGTELYVTTDDALNWTDISHSGISWTDSSYSSGLYVLTSTTYASLSEDLSVWEDHALNASLNLEYIANNGQVHATVGASASNAVMTSSVGSPFVTEDLKPVFFSDGATTDVTINKDVITNETFFENTAPVLEHRYTFSASDSADTGTGTTANGVDTGTITYNGSTAVPADTSSYIAVTATLTPKVVNIAFEKTADSADTKQLIDFQNSYMSLAIENNQLTLEKASTGGSVVVLAYVPDGNHLVSVRRTASSIDVIFNGLRVYTSASNTPASSTGFRLFRKFDNSSQSDLKLLNVEVEATLEPTDAQLLAQYNDFVKSGLIAQDYTVWNGNSRVVTVKTTGGDFTTTQAAVDALLADNETIEVYDDIDPTATGLPANAQIVDLAVEAATTKITWLPFG